MLIKDAQMLLRSAGYYHDAIDGDYGPKTRKAVEIVGNNRGGWPTEWSEARRIVAAGQAVLNAMGHEAGVVDGLPGHNTSEALVAYYGHDVTQNVVDMGSSTHKSRKSQTSRDLPRETQAELRRFYGPPGGPNCTAGRVKLQYPMVLAWDTDTKINSFACHILVQELMTGVFAQALEQYGTEKFERLGLNIFGGCFNNRNKRLGSTKSTHAWGIAVDLDPLKNRLRWDSSRASFAREEYVPFWRIVEAFGATSLGRAENRDWMHFQFADRN